MDSNNTMKETPPEETPNIYLVREENKMDMRAFFRDVERSARKFLAHYDREAKKDQSLFPYRMTRDSWWREFLKWAGKNETR